MSDTVSSNKLLREFAPQIEHTSTVGKLWIAFLTAVVLLGFFALYWQVSRGHIVTGMRDNVVWGVYIVNFIFFMGISYAGALISGTLHLFHA
jgi:molybdopterin-containing oxidoreductase family membrane subunit